MSSEENKKAISRLYEALNQGKYEVIDEIISPDYILHEPTPMDFGKGPDSVKRLNKMYQQGFPDQQVEIKHQIAEGDIVVTHWTTRGTNTGDLPGLPATGKNVTLDGVSINKFSEGKIVGEWVYYDRHKWLMDLGLVPEMQTVAVCADEKWDVGFF